MFTHGVSFHLGRFKVNGFSLASRATWIVIPSLKLIFDMGWCIEAMGNINQVFLSHLHQDHSLAIPSWLAWRNKHPETPEIYVHHKNKQLTIDFIDAVAKGEHTTFCYKVIGVKEGDEISLQNNYKIKIFESEHYLPTIGFQLVESRKKLKPQFMNCNPQEIKQAAADGQEVSIHKDIPILCYTSDTRPELFDRRPDLLESEILITECTHIENYLEYSKESLDKDTSLNSSHSYIQDLAPRLENFSGKVLALNHFPLKYHACDIYAFLLPRIPPSQRKKLCIIPYRDKTQNKLEGEIKTYSSDSIVPFAMEVYHNEKWEIKERKGYAGWRKNQLRQELQQKYPKYEIAHRWGDLLLHRNSAIQLYEDAYFEFLKRNSELVEWLINKACNIYDFSPEKIKAGVDYSLQEPSKPVHLQDIAIRRSLLRLGTWFKGKHLLEVRGMRSEGYVLNPGMVPFHCPDKICQPECELDWMLPGSIESFWQSNKVVIIPIEDK